MTPAGPADLAEALDRAATEARFAGAVRVDVAGRVPLRRAYGLAHRGLGAENTVGTRFGAASAAKSFTALTVMSLAEEGVLDVEEPVRRLLGADLPLVADDVTALHLLAHRSGIGDYLDEDDVGILDHVMPAPVHTYVTTSDYLPALDGRPTRFPAGERFSYNNSGFVVLALLAERATGRPFHDLVAERVLAPAGMPRTGYPRTDALPGDVAVGYLHAPDGPDPLRTNALHLPVVGSGDGGIVTTVDDVHALWAALDAGRVVTPGTLRRMTTAQGTDLDEGRSYGLGFWLEASGDGVMLEGYDAGVSFRSLHRPSSGLTWTVVSSWTDGAWPLVRLLADRFPPASAPG